MTFMERKNNTFNRLKSTYQHIYILLYSDVSIPATISVTVGDWCLYPVSQSWGTMASFVNNSRMDILYTCAYLLLANAIVIVSVNFILVQQMANDRNGSVMSYHLNLLSCITSPPTEVRNVLYLKAPNSPLLYTYVLKKLSFVEVKSAISLILLFQHKFFLMTVI